MSSDGGLSLLPVHGFVLAGGKSSRMGADKATMLFCGRPMVEIAVEKLREFCADVSLVGNREDLVGFAPVVLEERLDVGPVAGVEAGLLAAKQPWAMFMPVDVPLVPAELLRRWATDAIAMGVDGLAAAYLVANGEWQPAFSLLRRADGAKVSGLVDQGEHRLIRLIERAGEGDGTFAWGHDAGEFVEPYRSKEHELERWFANVNTPGELADAEAWSSGG